MRHSGNLYSSFPCRFFKSAKNWYRYKLSTITHWHFVAIAPQYWTI